MNIVYRIYKKDILEVRGVKTCELILMELQHSYMDKFGDYDYDNITNRFDTEQQAVDTLNLLLSGEYGSFYINETIIIQKEYLL